MSPRKNHVEDWLRVYEYIVRCAELLDGFSRNYDHADYLVESLCSQDEYRLRWIKFSEEKKKELIEELNRSPEQVLEAYVKGMTATTKY